MRCETVGHSVTHGGEIMVKPCAAHTGSQPFALHGKLHSADLSQTPGARPQAGLIRVSPRDRHSVGSACASGMNREGWRMVWPMLWMPPGPSCVLDARALRSAMPCTKCGLSLPRHGTPKRSRFVHVPFIPRRPYASSTRRAASKKPRCGPGLWSEKRGAIAVSESLAHHGSRPSFWHRTSRTVAVVSW
jgi:hypothetical protein